MKAAPTGKALLANIRLRLESFGGDKYSSLFCTAVSDVEKNI